ncbi:hypothetical protein [Frigoriglobus tundricola]|uniref:hypothetical protein n=1 Tax=Frigoriglobus tundricola TaxID=2774151 RepID=UPI00148EA98D|nr:hypothetical protein [Frigoriglobus tundricola]
MVRGRREERPQCRRGLDPVVVGQIGPEPVALLSGRRVCRFRSVEGRVSGPVEDGDRPAQEDVVEQGRGAVEWCE